MAVILHQNESFSELSIDGIPVFFQFESTLMIDTAGLKDGIIGIKLKGKLQMK